MNSAVYFLIQSPGMQRLHLKASKFNISNSNGFEVLCCNCHVFWKTYKEGNIKSHHFYQWLQVNKNILHASAQPVSAVFSMSGPEEERKEFNITFYENTHLSFPTFPLLQVRCMFVLPFE